MITVDKLQFTYPKAASRTLHGLTFSVEEQEIFGFLGPSGSGKSTTQKILIGLLKDYQGHVTVMGREVSNWGSDLYESLGVCFEYPNHYQRLTALENLQHFAALYGGPTLPPTEVLAWVGLEPDANKRVSAFSKGMKGRLNLARSLMHRPRVLVLDEPTSGLDPINAKRVKELILKVRNDGTTVFLTTHDMTVADELCDRVAFIIEGTLQAIDSPKTFKQTYGRRMLDVTYIDADKGSQCVEFPLDNLAENNAFQATLRDHVIESIHSQETTLETVFVEVTGKRLVMS